MNTIENEVEELLKALADKLNGHNHHHDMQTAEIQKHMTKLQKLARADLYSLSTQYEVNKTLGKTKYHYAKVVLSSETGALIHHHIVVKPEVLAKLKSLPDGFKKDTLVEAVRDDIPKATGYLQRWISKNVSNQ